MLQVLVANESSSVNSYKAFKKHQFYKFLHHTLARIHLFSFKYRYRPFIILEYM